MGWRIEFSGKAEKELSSLDKPQALRILNYLDELAALSDPRKRGKALAADLSGLWRYRVGAWRVLCKIEDSRLLVLVVKLSDIEAPFMIKVSLRRPVQRPPRLEHSGTTRWGWNPHSSCTVFGRP